MGTAQLRRCGPGAATDASRANRAARRASLSSCLGLPNPRSRPPSSGMDPRSLSSCWDGPTRRRRRRPHPCAARKSIRSLDIRQPVPPRRKDAQGMGTAQLRRCGPGAATDASRANRAARRASLSSCLGLPNPGSRPSSSSMDPRSLSSFWDGPTRRRRPHPFHYSMQHHSGEPPALNTLISS